MVERQGLVAFGAAVVAAAAEVVVVVQVSGVELALVGD